MFHDDMIHNIAARISRVHTFILLHYAQIILSQHNLNNNVDVVNISVPDFLNVIHHMKMFCHYFHNVLL